MAREGVCISNHNAVEAERDAVGGAVLDGPASGRVVEHVQRKVARWVGIAFGVGVERARVVGLAVRAVVENDLQVGETGEPGLDGDLDELALIGPIIVVVKFVDPGGNAGHAFAGGEVEDARIVLHVRIRLRIRRSARERGRDVLGERILLRSFLADAVRAVPAEQVVGQRGLIGQINRISCILEDGVSVATTGQKAERDEAHVRRTGGYGPILDDRCGVVECDVADPVAR